MGAAEEPVDSETYDLISSSLSHPIRRKMLRLLSERGRMNFTDLRNSVGIDGSHLSYHLNQLGELLRKHEDGSYGLSYLGALSVSLMQDVEESSGRRAREPPTIPRFERPAYELPASEIVASSLRLYLSRPLELLLPFIVVGAVVETIVVLFAPPGASLTATVLIWPDVSFTLTNFMTECPLLSHLAQVVFLAFVVSGPFGAVADGLVVRFASENLEGRDPTLGDSLAFAMSRLLPLYFARIIAGILVAVGTVLFIVPGVVLSIVFHLLDPVIIVERVHPLSAFERSRSLLEKRWTKTLEVTIAISCLALILVFPLFLLLIAAKAVSEPLAYSLFVPASSLLAPLAPISKTYLYYCMRVKDTTKDPPPST